MALGDWLRRLFGSPSPPPEAEARPASQARQSPYFPAKRPDRVNGAAGQFDGRREDAAKADTAIEVLLLHPTLSEDELLPLLEARGLTPLEAWQAARFLPIAFTHVVMRGAGVQFQPGYVIMDLDTGARNLHLLADEPFYLAGVASAERRLAEGCTPHQLLPVFGRSAEYDVLQKLAGPGGRLDGIVLTEPLLMSFQSRE